MTLKDIIESLLKLAISDDTKLYTLLALLAPIVLCYCLFPKNFPNNTIIATIYVLFFIVVFRIIYKTAISKRVEFKRMARENLRQPLLEVKAQFIELKQVESDIKNHYISISKKSNYNGPMLTMITKLFEITISYIDKRLKKLDEIIEKCHKLDTNEIHSDTVGKNYKSMVYFLFVTYFVFWVLKILPYSDHYSMFLLYNIAGFIALFIILLFLHIIALYLLYFYFKIFLLLFRKAIPFCTSSLDCLLKKRQVMLADKK